MRCFLRSIRNYRFLRDRLEMLSLFMGLNGFIYSTTEVEITCPAKGLHDDISREVNNVLSRQRRGHRPSSS
jgi:hypothetical protein